MKKFSLFFSKISLITFGFLGACTSANPKGTPGFTALPKCDGTCNVVICDASTGQNRETSMSCEVAKKSDFVDRANITGCVETSTNTFEQINITKKPNPCPAGKSDM